MLTLFQSKPGQERRTGMDALITLIALVAPWSLLAIFAGRNGVDSRDPIPDDHRR